MKLKFQITVVVLCFRWVNVRTEIFTINSEEELERVLDKLGIPISQVLGAEPVEPPSSHKSSHSTGNVYVSGDLRVR